MLKATSKGWHCSAFSHLQGLLALGCIDRDIGPAGIVANGDIDVLGGDVHAGADGDTGVARVETLGGLDAVHGGSRRAGVGEELEAAPRSKSRSKVRGKVRS